MNKFKVGDRVRLLNKNDWNVDIQIGEIYTISSYKPHNLYPYECEENSTSLKEEWLEIVGKRITNNTTNIMSKIKTFVKNLALSEDEKALRQIGFKTDCGEYTQEAIDLVIQELCKEKESKLINIANGIIAEEKDAK